MTTALDTPVRLLPAAPEDLRAHLARYGPAPYRNQSGALIADVEASGLTGRGRPGRRASGPHGGRGQRRGKRAGQPQG
jgi:hypothetical protein